MKKIFTAILALLACLSAYASTPTDTTYRFTNADTVRIVESASGIVVNVVGDESIEIDRQFTEGVLHRTHRGFSFRPGRSSRVDVFVQGLMLGFVSAAGAPEGMDVEMGKSLEIGVLNLLGVKYCYSRTSEFSIGFGLDWRNYRSTRGTLFVAEDGRVGLSTFPQEVTPRFSRLKIFTLQFPILYSCRLGRAAGNSAWLSLGPVMCLNTHGSLKTSWLDAESGEKTTVTSNDIGQRKFTIDFIGTLSLGGIGVYVRYSPYKVLTSAQAPDFATLSAGFGLAF